MGKVENIDGKPVDEVGEEKPAKSAAPPDTPFNYEEGVQAAILIEAEQAKINDIMDDAKKRCSPMNEQIEKIKKEAAENGVTKKVLNHVLADRSAERKRAASFAKLSNEHQGQAQQLALDLEKTEEEAEQDEAA